MILADTNPFHELFVTHSAPDEEFVRYFSPFLVPNLLELFQDGNVVLKGTQGCGKSMLLSCSRRRFEFAYAKRGEELRATGEAGVDFPVPEVYRSFVGAGVNLSKSGLLDIAQMLPSDPKDRDFQLLTALFCDFFNYWLLRDLLNRFSSSRTTTMSSVRWSMQRILTTLRKLSEVKTAGLGTSPTAIPSPPSESVLPTGC